MTMGERVLSFTDSSSFIIDSLLRLPLPIIHLFLLFGQEWLDRGAYAPSLSFNNQLIINRLINRERAIEREKERTRGGGGKWAFFACLIANWKADHSAGPRLIRWMSAEWTRSSSQTRWSPSSICEIVCVCVNFLYPVSVTVEGVNYPSLVNRPCSNQSIDQLPP